MSNQEPSSRHPNKPEPFREEDTRTLLLRLLELLAAHIVEKLRPCPPSERRENARKSVRHRGEGR
jgi:hypothetical protein